MHSALIALSASRIYTLLRAEPLKKPSFMLPLRKKDSLEERVSLIPALGYRSSGSITAARRLTERKSWNCERGKKSGRGERDKGTTKGNPVAYKGG
ncbi:hypothetical protein ALC57_03850 [Trachymyrmex cornetzi]|uniref:Uncharacterized protein n=1 Tax=Trachymyrmex cornetzi TaxID=471704 RepID=A0A195EFY7_9HYME|nr:hypothetical protein ALC57_03850 [Trachymyrmex cornetzi]